MICRCPLRTLARWMWIKYCGRILPWTVWLRPIPMDWKRRMEFLEAKRLAFLTPYSGPTVIWNSAKMFFVSFKRSIDWLIDYRAFVLSSVICPSIDWLIDYSAFVLSSVIGSLIDWLIDCSAFVFSSFIGDEGASYLDFVQPWYSLSNLFL